jgi:hypothetical protein
MKNRIGIWLISALFIFGCSNRVHVLQQTSSSFARAGSFTWVPSRPGTEGISLASPAYLQESMRQTVNSYLLSNDWQEVNLDPDYLFLFDIMKESKESAGINNLAVSRSYYNPFTLRQGMVTYPIEAMEVNEGEDLSEILVFLNIIDATTDKTAWQGWTKQKVNKEITEEDISAAAHVILQRFLKR